MISIRKRGGRRVAILQSNYIPWKGYFDIIGSVDAFIVYDDVQYSKNHWHNRNVIKTQHGLKWLTIPVSKTEGAFQTIDSVRVSSSFAQKHWRTISQSYAKATYFPMYQEEVASLFREIDHMNSLSELNVFLLKAICALLKINTEFISVRDLQSRGQRTDRLVALCKELDATTYLSGPSAQTYIEVEKFREAKIELEWMSYAGYPQYPQLHGQFEHGVSILDLLFNMGPTVRNFMKTRKV